ncbi:hypothetical protein HMN09_01141600 [Mycena chlorophos]|uniref:Decapping nuclease n=1 Tax=Mycena chlorophos TaxID=658473 RepID=A0A8H6S991_MYCCL|nr:hypothetical protein HMN09_01141600 [Mycena chlorophos]
MHRACASITLPSFSSSGLSSPAPRLRPACQILEYTLVEKPRATRVLNHHTQSLRRFVAPNTTVDVGRLLRWAPYAPRVSRLLLMLEACMRSEAGRHALEQADVVAERHTLAKLMNQDNKTSRAFNAFFVNGTLFLEEHIPQSKRLKINRTATNRRIGFLHACSELLSGMGENHTHTFNTVVARSLGGLNVLLGGRVDCVATPYTHDPSCYIQLLVDPGNGHYAPTRKRLAFLRALLSDTPTTVIGTIDASHILRHTQILSTSALLEAATTPNYQWSLDGSLRFAAHFLSTLRDHLQSETDALALQQTVGDARARAIGWGDTGGSSNVWRVELVPQDLREAADPVVVVQQLDADDPSIDRPVVTPELLGSYRRRPPNIGLEVCHGVRTNSEDGRREVWSSSDAGQSRSRKVCLEFGHQEWSEGPGQGRKLGGLGRP